MDRADEHRLALVHRKLSHPARLGTERRANVCVFEGLGLVGADVPDGMHLIAPLDHGDLPALDLDHLRAALLKVGDRAGIDQQLG